MKHLAPEVSTQGSLRACGYGKLKALERIDWDGIARGLSGKPGGVDELENKIAYVRWAKRSWLQGKKADVKGHRLHVLRIASDYENVNLGCEALAIVERHHFEWMKTITRRWDDIELSEQEELCITLDRARSLFTSLGFFL